MNLLHIEIINTINGFLQRTDQIAWKLTSKYYLANLIHNTMSLNEELNLYIKTIDKLDYAWKGDSRYINIREIGPTGNYDMLKKFAVITNLWYFDFNAEFNVFGGSHVILFLTSISNYKINIEHTDFWGNFITKSTHTPVKNKIKINFVSGGKIKVNCREIKNLKDNKTVQYIMCIPEYYWNKIYSNKYKTDWNRQILCTNGSDRKIIVKF